MCIICWACGACSEYFLFILVSGDGCTNQVKKNNKKPLSCGWTPTHLSLTPFAAAAIATCRRARPGRPSLSRPWRASLLHSRGCKVCMRVRERRQVKGSSASPTWAWHLCRTQLGQGGHVWLHETHRQLGSCTACTRTCTPGVAEE